MEYAASIDIVITWVDGSDPHWRKKKAQYRPDSHRSLLTADVEGRYRCNEELRFLLRSIDRYWQMPGSIFLVTDQQVPGFIRSHPRLVVVDHRDFMSSDSLPVFSSRAIEANLHRIRDLSEHYVAFNDDMFLTKPVCFDDFFSVRGAVIYLSDERLPTCAGTQNLAGHDGGIRARNWIVSRYGTSCVDHVIEHYPKGIRKSWMAELEAEDRAIFVASSKARFRETGTQSIVANLYGHWCLANGRGEIRRNACVYLESADIELDRELYALAPIVNGKLCLCINDTTDNRDDVGELHTRTSGLLNTLFPGASPYERTDCTFCSHTCLIGQKCHIHKTENLGLRVWPRQAEFQEREQRRA